jgi:hypothetical protein
MRHRHGPTAVAVLFFAFAVMFSLVFWPEVSLAAKLAFFAAGIGFGASITRSVRRGQTG